MRCSLCPGINKCLPVSGPQTEGQPLFIGEAPGHDENRKGKVFIGKTGIEVNDHYLPQAGLRRESSTFTNAIKCLPDRPKGKLDLKEKKDVALLESCASTFLYNEIANIQPSLLVPMGAFACHAIDPSIDLELHHGMPVETAFGVPAFPMYHPAGGIHEPKKMLQIRTDWIRLRRYLRGVLHVPVDAYPNPDYQAAGVADISDIDCTLPITADTEHSRSRGPYFLTWSQLAGTARLIEAANKEHIKLFQKKLDRFEADAFFHNKPYDWTITEDMGLAIPRRTRDTMMLTYHLGNLPQGLKVLAYRLLGMTMQDFEDLVRPYSKARVMDYYQYARTFDWPKPEEQLVQDETTGQWKSYKPQGLNTKLKRLFTDLSKNPNKDIFKVWDTWEMHRAELEEHCGPYYGLDIADVPFEEALYYACRDADATIRLVPILEKMKVAAMSGKLQEQWEL